jgi:hypothetical protein
MFLTTVCYKKYAIILDIVHLLEFCQTKCSEHGSVSIIMCKEGKLNTQLVSSERASHWKERDLLFKTSRFKSSEDG